MKFFIFPLSQQGCFTSPASNLVYHIKIISMLVGFFLLFSCSHERWGYKNGTYIEKGWVDPHTYRARSRIISKNIDFTKKEIRYIFFNEIDSMRNDHFMHHLKSEDNYMFIATLKGIAREGKIVKKYTDKQGHGVTVMQFTHPWFKDLVISRVSPEQRRSIERKKKAEQARMAAILKRKREKNIKEWSFGKHNNEVYGFIDAHRFRIQYRYKNESEKKIAKSHALKKAKGEAMYKLEKIFHFYLYTAETDMGAPKPVNMIFTREYRKKLLNRIYAGTIVSKKWGRNNDCSILFQVKLKGLRDKIYQVNLQR
ncbi:MAG: hypothetical protein GY754_35870 [bacterium]|nr:hypothetical protein [bacterium]